MSKKVTFGKKHTGSRPTTKATSESQSRYKEGADDWVAGEGNDQEKKGQVSSDDVAKLKRLTIDIPEEHHKLIKLVAVQKGSTIADILRKMIARQVKSAVIPS